MIDVRQPSSPQFVATFTILGFNPHNFWLDEDRSILYVAWSGNGVRAIDVSGILMGNLELQGRQIAGLKYDTDNGRDGPSGTRTSAYSLQIQGDLVYVTDYTTGLWVLQSSF